MFLAWLSMDKRYAIAVSHEDHALVTELAQKLGRSRADIVREALAGFVLIRDLNEQIARKETRPWQNGSESPSRRQQSRLSASALCGRSSMTGRSDDQ